MITEYRSILADERCANRAMIGHTINRPRHRPLHALGAENALGISIGTRFSMSTVEMQLEIVNSIAIDMSSGGCHLKSLLQHN